MTVLQKITNSKDPAIFTMYREGMFYKCYNEDAMLFSQRVKDFKISAKYIKSAGSMVLSLGFPGSLMEKGAITSEGISDAMDATSWKDEPNGIVFQLAKAICDRTYTPKPGIAFIIHKPVMREIFAADFSDRIIHHLIYRCIYPIIDRKLIHDTYSCRAGKGTLYGVNRAKKFMRSCSRNFSQEAFVLKADIEAYFMNMKHEIIYDKVVELLPENKTGYLGLSRDTLLYLLRQTIFNKVTENCRIKGSKSDWVGLPPGKSLFHYTDDTGLPIGNLTSQVFGNGTFLRATGLQIRLRPAFECLSANFEFFQGVQIYHGGKVEKRNHGYADSYL